MDGSPGRRQVALETGNSADGDLVLVRRGRGPTDRRLLFVPWAHGRVWSGCS
jgi:hypothetical protein